VTSPRLLYGLVAAVYLLSFPYHPGLRSPNELSRLMQTRALVDFGEPSLNRAMALYGSVGDLSVYRGLYFPSKAPLLSYAAVPIYAVLRAAAGGQPGAVPEIPLVFFGRLFLTVLPTLLCLALLRRFLVTYVPVGVADAVVLTYALGTLAFSYGLLFMSHQTTAVLLFVSFYLIWRWYRAELGRPGLVAGGMLAGLAVTAEYTSALCAVILAAYVLMRDGGIPKRIEALALFVAGAAGPAFALMAYHAMCFGSPFETGYRHLADIAYQPWHEGGLLGIHTPRPDAFLGSFFSPLRGLFALSPALLLGYAGLGALAKRRESATELHAVFLFTVLLVAGYVYFTSSFSYASWGWTTGPRHLTGLVPFLLLPASLLTSQARGSVQRGICAGLVVASVVLTAGLTFVNYIPDDVSEAFFGLSIPLMASGYWVPTVLAFLGLANPLSGVLVGLLVLATVVGIVRLLGARRPAELIGLGVVLVAILLLHRAAYQGTPQDAGARTLLRTRWLAAPGDVPAFWSTDGRHRQR
jgi:hypothetical protein